MWIRLTSRLVLLAAAASVAIAPTAALAIPAQGETVTVPHSFQPGYDTYTEFHTGVADLKAGRYQDAEAHFSHVLAMVPTDADSMFLLGMARSGRGDLGGARRAFQDTLRLDPQRVFAHRELALIYIKQGQPDRARAELAFLKQRAAECGGTCSDADALAEAVKSVEAGLPTG
jgi:Flp pilus assembly protein TadD